MFCWVGEYFVDEWIDEDVDIVCEGELVVSSCLGIFCVYFSNYCFDNEIGIRKDVC